MINDIKKSWGKLLGASLGFVFAGGPAGAVIGMLIGHAYDTRREFTGQSLWETVGASPTSFAGTSQQAAFTMGVVVLSAKMAKADGKVTRAEIDAFKRVFQITPQQEKQIGRLFDNARKSAENFEPYAFQLAQIFATTPAVLEQVLSGLFVIAGADSAVITPPEARFLKQVAYIFNYGPEDFKRIAARSGVRLPNSDNIREHERDTSSEPFAILGVTEKSTNDEIKAAYRNLIRKHHPDKLVAEGMPPEFIATANEKMKRINAAYDTVSKLRGIK